MNKKVSDQGIAESKRDEIIAEKIAQISRSAATNSGFGRYSSEEFNKVLFGRAPLDFLTLRSASELASVGAMIHERVLRFVSSGSEIEIESLPSTDFSTIVIALKDRPFIVNTIMECCREEGVRVLTLLHPIFRSDSVDVSFNYLELEPLPHLRLEALTEKMTHALRILEHVTDDYGAIRESARKLQLFFAGSDPHNVEIGHFLEWLQDGQFNFFGHVAWSDERKGDTLPGSELGLLRRTNSNDTALWEQVRQDVRSLSGRSDVVLFTTLAANSPVHRRVPLIHIVFRNGGESHSFVGLFTSKALAQECSTIPLIRQKFQAVVRSEGFVEHTHDYKSVMNIIDSLPKDEAFRLSVEELRTIAISALDVATSSETIVSLWSDPEHRSLSVFVVVLQEQYDSTIRRGIESYLLKRFHLAPVSSAHHLDITNRPVVRLHFNVSLQRAPLSDADLRTIREEVIKLASSWHEDLVSGLSANFPAAQVPALLRLYSQAFPDDYKSLQTIDDALADIRIIETMSAHHRIRLGLAQNPRGASDRATIVLYSRGEKISISHALPALENGGFEIISEQSWEITPLGCPTVFSSRFAVRSKSGRAVDPGIFSSIVAPGLEGALLGEDNDILNSLLFEAELPARSISLLRAYTRFLWQVRKLVSRFSIARSLASYPELSAALVEIFEQRFNPALSLSLEERAVRSNALSEKFHESLRKVKDISADGVLRSLLSLIEHTVRTNYYLNLPAIAIKVRSQSVDIMPHPRPLFEIFVSSPAVEGVHLRSGVVARGGIRWSDRPDDYRSEVLGLMKTQRIKNALIVPTGAKGGFIVKHLPSDPAQVPAAVQNAYREYVRAMLSITDNRSDDRVVHPEGVVIWDGEDPYFVVAADKGTATFSDLANTTAMKEFNFWFGDAFASGGSNGYDHKLYGITARGAWECAKRHFHDLERNCEAEPITVVGIGDMAGDVFGNGLLLMPNCKLIAAFNHRHIFIDPDPVPSKAAAERERLFKKPGSQWSDYAPSLVSAGGAIYDRFEKEIHLSAQARKSLGIPTDAPLVMNGDTLVNFILKAPADLLWNGGIGTYVKARTQSNADVADGANDAVRVNSDELRFRVVAEGGNLGFTQLARIDFAARGGCINTDAIDNSAGVDLSDHEVNIKILFAGLIRDKTLSVEERNILLKQMANEVCEAVLDHNRSQALLLTLAVRRSEKNLEYFQLLLRDLVRLGYVNRVHDLLPDDDELLQRSKDNRGLTRPEISICLATVKMWVKDVLLETKLPENPLLHEFAMEYFPLALRQRFPGEILRHPLLRNIIASQVANYLVDTMGSTAIHRLSRQYALPANRVIECALAAELMLGTRHLRRTLILNDLALGQQAFIAMAQQITQALVDCTGWFLSRHGLGADLELLDKQYRGSWQELLRGADEALPPDVRHRFLERFQRYLGAGLVDYDARRLALFPDLVTPLEVVAVAHETGATLLRAATVYSLVVDKFSIDLLLSRCSAIDTKNKWETELVASTVDDIRGCVSRLTAKLLSRNKVRDAEVEDELNRGSSLDLWRALIDEERSRSPQVASLAVLARHLQTYSRG